MPGCTSAGEAIANALHTCPVLYTKLGLQGLALLEASSKNFQSIVVGVVRSYGLDLLDAALGTARGSGQLQHMQAAAWLAMVLLRGVPAMSAGMTERLLTLPAVPPDTAKRLIAAGMRVSYAQLLAAAQSMVAGVEVWVQAQQQLGIHTDIPAAAVTICCGNDWARIRLRAQGGTVLLQLAFNCSNPQTAAAAITRLPATAAAAARRVPALLQPDVARKLLVTAATRQHVTAVRHMVCLDYVRPHVDAGTLEAVLMQTTTDWWCGMKLCKLPAAQQLSSEAVARLLQATAKDGYCSVMSSLTKLPAAQQISSETMLQLLRVAGQRGSDVNTLCELPGAQQLSSEAVLQLLRVAGQRGSDVNALCQLPGAQQLSRGAVLQLLQAALEHPTLSPSLRLLPAAEHISIDSVMQLMETAIWHGFEHLEELCLLPQVANFSSEAAAVLLKKAIELSCHECLDSLCHDLPSVQELDAEQVTHLLLAAAETGQPECTKVLLYVPAAAQLNAEQVRQLLETAVSHGSAGCLIELCDLTAVDSLSSEQMVQLLSAAMKQGSVGCTKELCSLPAAQQLSGKAAAGLLQAAEQDGSFKCMACAAVLRQHYRLPRAA